MTPRTGRPVKDLDKGPGGKAWSFRLAGEEAELLESTWQDYHRFGSGSKQMFLREIVNLGLDAFVTKFNREE